MTTNQKLVAMRVSITVSSLLLISLTIRGQKTTATADDSNVRPPVTKADLQIAKLARQLLNSPAKWNRNDNRVCPAGAKTLSLYCAFATATAQVSGKSEHRGAALQEARFVIDEIAGDRNYEHRLMNYNNDPTTTFDDIQEVLRVVEWIITVRLKGSPKTTPAPVSLSANTKPTLTGTDIAVVKRARLILDSPAKWNRHDTQDCPADAQVVSLYCTLKQADIEVNGKFDDGGATIREARHVIDETAPNRKTYKSRLTDFNNDPTTTFADIQKLLQLVEERLAKRLADSGAKQ
jgi:hypothetical protein